MLSISKKYVLDEQMHKVAVQLDLSTFERIEKLLEDYALAQYIMENEPSEIMTVNEAKAEYKKLKKKP